MWFGVDFCSTIHPSNDGNGAHIDQVHSKVRCLYFLFSWCDEISSGWDILVVCWLFCNYEDFALFEFVVVCEHHCGQLPFVWVAHENEEIFYCLPIWRSILVIRSTCSIIMEVLRVFTFMCTTIMKLKYSTQWRWHVQRLL